MDVRRLSVRVLIALAFLASPAYALSVFDAIQLSKNGYDDQAIIDLIEATDSAFALEADDLPKLKELGVSEAVIRAMLERSATAGPGDEGDEEVEASTEHPLNHHDTPDAPTPQSDNPFTSRPLLEARGGGHVHRSLELDGLNLLVLRDEGTFGSIDARAHAIVERLGDAWTAVGGRFRTRPIGSGVRVVFSVEASETNESADTIQILTVSAGDALGYERRSGRDVTSDLLARYWSDLLNDYWAIAHGKSPERLMMLHEGEALAVLREALTRLDASNRSLGAAADGIPSATRHHLERLAQAIPMEYHLAGGH